MKIPLDLLIKRTGNRRKRFVFASPEPRVMDRVRLYRMYMRVVKHWQEAKGAIMAQYEEELSTVSARDARWSDMSEGVREIACNGTLFQDSIDDLNSTIDSEGNWFTRLFVELRAEIETWTLGVELWQRGKWRGAVLSASGVDLDTMLYAGDVEQTLQATIEQNVALIRDVNEKQRSQITQAVFRGLNQRLPARDVAAEIDRIADTGRKRALLIASDQLQKAATALSVERAHQAGLGGRYEWVHSGKLHPREWHKARNGKIFDDAAKPGSEEYVPPDDRPGIPIRCGCRRRGVLELDNFDEEGNLIDG